MKKTIILLSVLIFAILIQANTSIVKAQDINKALQYFDVEKYKDAALEFEKALPSIEKEYGKKDTSYYSKLLLYTAISFEYYLNYAKAEYYYLAYNEVYKSINAEHCLNYSTGCNSLALLYDALGEYKKAEALYIKALNIRVKIYGKEHILSAVSYNNLATLYFAMGEYKKAEPLFIESKSIREKVLGIETSSYATSCDNLASLYKNIGNYKKAASLFLEAKEIREKIYGKEHLTYAISCNNLAVLYVEIEQYEKAKPFLIEAKNIREKKLGKEHPQYAISCNNLASLYQDLDNYSKAESLYIEAMKINEKVYGKEHPSYALCCNNLASLYNDINNYKKTVFFYKEAKRIYEKIHGKQHPDYAMTCNNLALLYYNIGKYQKAEALYIEAKQIYKKIYGTEHITYAKNCANLALLYNTMGNYKKAEPLYIEAKQSYKNLFGKNHSLYAQSCGNLAVFYQETGNYKKAETLLIESSKIYKNIFGENNKDYAITISDLAVLYDDLGDYKKAETFYIKAKKIIEEQLGKKHNIYGNICGNLALLYYNTERYKEAEILGIEAKEITETIFGKEHLNYAIRCNFLAGLYNAKGNYSKAKPLYIEAKNIKEKVLGRWHSSYALSCINLASLYDNAGNYQKAEPLYIEANEIITFLSKESTKFMSEKEREKYLEEKISYNFEVFHSFFLTRRKENKKLAGIVYNNALNIKGQLLKSTIAVRKAILQSGDTALINTYNEMNTYGKILSRQYALPIAKRRTDIKEVEEKLNVLEKKLTRKTQNFAKVSNFDKVDWQTIQNSLKEDETAIEFIHFEYRNDTEWTDSTLYYALILRKEYKYPKAVFLFEQKELTKMLQNVENDDAQNVAKIYKSRSAKPFGIKPTTENLKLDSLIWQPIDNYLKTTKTVYISPTGLLNKIAFDALPYKDSILISDKYNIVYTSCTANIVQKTEFNFSDINDIALFGGIKYSANETELKEANKNNKNNTSRAYYSSEKSRGVNWSYLSGTKKEIENIDILFKKKAKSITTKTFSGVEASEEAFKSLENNAPSILHISTHGFYFPEPKTIKKDNSLDNNIQYKYSDNPLVRSGLLLAGGNHAWSGEKPYTDMEDGVLSAYETSQLSFFKTQLVVLSACQTGLGDVKGSEGVFGLQRAFKMAGVDYIIMSLWSVPDTETQEFMSLFYENFFTEKEIKKAFDKTQKFMKNKYKGEPYKWAAFVLIN